MPTYFCHACRSDVDVLRENEELICSRCRGGFIEEVERQPQQQQPPPQAQPSPQGAEARQPHFHHMPHMGFPLFGIVGQGPGGQPVNMDPFFQNLLSQLMNNAEVRVHFEDPTDMLHGNVGDYAWGPGGMDRIITQLMAQLDQPMRPTIPPEALERIPMRKVDEEDVKNGAQCTTCMEMFKLDERVAHLECRHIFHKPCILPWLKRQSTCPICRKEVKADWFEKQPEPSAEGPSGTAPPPGAPGGLVDEDLD